MANSKHGHHSARRCYETGRNTVRCHYKAVNFLTNIHKRHPMARPSFLDPASDWYSASVSAIICVIFYNIGPRYASVTSSHGPRTILSPVRFLARKTEWSARRNFMSVLFSWSHQVTDPVRLDTAVHLLYGWVNDSQHSTGTPDTLRWESLVGVLHKGSKCGTLIFLFVVRLDKALNKQSICWVIWDTMTLTLPFLVITSIYKDKMGSPFILIIAFIYSEKIVFMLKVTLALTLHESCRHLMAFYHLIANAKRSPTQATATHWWLNIRLQ